MEGLAPPMKCLIEIQSALQNGEPVRSGVQRYLSVTPPNDEFGVSMRRFLFAWDQGRDWRALLQKIESPHRRALLDLVATGLAGHPILHHLDELKAEIANACELEIQHHLEILPVKMLIPLLIFQFPSFLVLLFGPLLNRLIEEINR